VDGVVTFLKEGKLFTITLDKLSAKDQQIVRDLTMGKPPPDEDAPPVAAAPTTSTSPAASGTPSAAAKIDDADKPARIAIEVRTWTDERGNKTNAKFVRINGSDVVLNRSGKILTVSYHTLSEEDQQYIRDVLTQDGKQELIPAAREASTAGGTGAGITGPGFPTGPVTSGIPPSPFPPAGGGRGRGPGSGIGQRGPGGIPAAGAPGGGFPGGGFPGAGGAPPTLPTPPAGVPMAGAPGGIEDLSGPGLSGGNTGPGSTFGPGSAFPPSTFGPGSSTGPAPTPTPGPGFGPGQTFGNGPSFPSGSSSPGFPTSPATSTFPTSPAFPTGPTFEQVYKCSGCSREISQEQSKLDRCPYCKTLWVYKDDGTGSKTITSGGVRNLAIGLGVGIVVVILGGVAGFIGIIVAIVRAVSRPARQANYRRY
jgi:DNA-directed RNA polymerase subunit RPC12/RpoP